MLRPFVDVGRHMCMAKLVRRPLACVCGAVLCISGCPPAQMQEKRSFASFVNNFQTARVTFICATHVGMQATGAKLAQFMQ